MARSPEFRLAVECCRSAFAGADAGNIHELGLAVDWPLFVRFVRFHRIQGLVWQCIAPLGDLLPRQFAGELSADASEIAAANLRSAVECRDLLCAFRHAEIPLLFVKGLTLATLAYGSISTKSGIDIDLLIPREKLRDAAAILIEQGYRSVIPRGVGNCERLEAWHRHRKESVWFGAGRRLQIDLHTRLVDHPWLIPMIGLNSPRQSVEVSSGIALPTLGSQELFAYLAVHGASSAWFRLKWITDVAALLHRTEAIGIEALFRRSQELGAGRAAAQALLLADTVYGTLGELESLRHELNRDPLNRLLHAAAVKQMAGRTDPVEPTSRAFGTAMIHLSQFALLPGWRFKMSELIRQGRVALR